MKRVFLIENPVASRASERGRRRVLDTLRADGCRIEHARTSGPGDAERLAADAVAHGHEIIAVYGGDGTVMQAVAGMRGSDAVLGVIPAGTGNLLAGNLRIPRNPVRAAAVIASGRPRTIDLVRLETSDGARFFAVGAGTGYDAEMMAATTHRQKRRWGFGAYIGFVLRTAHRIERRPVYVTVDGERTRHEAAMAIVANCAEIMPPLLRLGPDVAIDDGVLDLVILETGGVWGVGMAVLSLLLGRDTRRIRRRRGTDVRIETDEPRPVQADGDLCGETPLRATMIAGGLTVMAPDDGSSGGSATRSGPCRASRSR
jgi:YegS/Rv2252/BmrU family lipid kinase